MPQVFVFIQAASVNHVDNLRLAESIFVVILLQTVEKLYAPFRFPLPVQTAPAIVPLFP